VLGGKNGLPLEVIKNLDTIHICGVADYKELAEANISLFPEKEVPLWGDEGSN
jgi:hypothetical protein